MKSKCTFCQGDGYDETISDCCGETRDPDTGLCYGCHDHCGPMECPECGGKGYLNIEYNDSNLDTDAFGNCYSDADPGL